MLPFSHLTPAFHPLAAGSPDSLQKSGSIVTSVLEPRRVLSPSPGPPQRCPLSLRHWPEAASPPGPCPFPGSVAAPVSIPHILSRGPSPAAFASPSPSTAGVLWGLSFGSSPAPVSRTDWNAAGLGFQGPGLVQEAGMVEGRSIRLSSYKLLVPYLCQPFHHCLSAPTSSWINTLEKTAAADTGHRTSVSEKVEQPALLTLIAA